MLARLIGKRNGRLYSAIAQGKALGFEPALVYVEHPIQDRTDEEMGAIARGALAEILQALGR